MIVIKGQWLTFGELWFTDETPGHAGVDILAFRLAPRPVPRASCAPFHTLVNDLTLPEGAILAGFGRTNRYKINRADSRDGVAFDYIEDCGAHLNAFCEFYDAFARQKSLHVAYRRGLQAAANAGALVLTRATRGADTLVWHAYIRSKDRAALLHSASHFRGGADEDRAVIARTNRWLHWRDMLELKCRGGARYDWGGMFEDESVPAQASVNGFKREFGGAAQIAYTCSLPLTLKGRAYRSVVPALERFTGGITPLRERPIARL